MRALLDINVLLALLDRDHADHQRARDWLATQIADGWASCAITQNGFVQIVSQPRYPSPVPATEAIARLAAAVATEHHEFWICSISVLDDDVVDRTSVLGPRQVTDTYLLALAAAHGGRFVTFDRSVPLTAARAARASNLEVL